MRILIAEDDAGLRDLLVQGMEESGFIVDGVGRGDDAIAQLEAYSYDVAILDWKMPGATGVDVAHWARDHGRPTAILLLTAMDRVADRIQGLEAGADDYLVKPFDFGELLARIRALQRRPRSTDGDHLVRGDLTLDVQRREILVNVVTLSVVAPPTTWLFVTMSPLVSYTMPDPRPTDVCSCTTDGRTEWTMETYAFCSASRPLLVLMEGAGTGGWVAMGVTLDDGPEEGLPPVVVPHAASPTIIVAAAARVAPLRPR